MATTNADLIVATLKKAGIGHGFGVPSGNVLPLLEAMRAVAGSAGTPEVRAYAARMQVPPDKIRMGVLVQRMAPPGKELLLGMVRDPQFGPLVVVGFGGIYVEVLRDTATRLAPVSPAEALRMLGELKMAALLRGVRGEPPVGLQALAETISRFGQLVVDCPDLLEVELNPLVATPTGVVAVDRYAVVDDVGTVINPLTLKGQIHGGVVQGLSQILFERIEYDPESGQLLTGSFMDYCMPRADDVCSMEVGSNPVPTKLNPLGVKGAGEAGTVGALPAVMNAIMDALAPLGVKEFDMPATGDRVWRAIRQARSMRQ